MPITGLEEIEVTDDALAELGMPSTELLRARKTRSGDRFVKGPIPLRWLSKVNMAANTAVIAQIIKSLVDTRGGEPVAVPDEVWQTFKLTRNARKRALDALEHAGIIRTERLPGKSTRIWLVDKP